MRSPGGCRRGRGTALAPVGTKVLPSHMSALLKPEAEDAAPDDAGEAGVRPDDELELPMHRRLVVQYATNDGGRRELRLYHQDKEISFDEPEMFAFGEALARQPRFIASEATAWGTGYAWSTVRDLLGRLVASGVLRAAGTGGADGATALRMSGDDGARASPLPPSSCPHARAWTEGGTVMRELTGRALDPAYLEMVVPVFRVAHMSLDADGRQIGEANVFPPALRLDVPTRWRECIYAGTRHKSDRPMNVTALKAMRAHWGSMMALLLHVRAAYLRRFPDAASGWTVGHLERLSTCVLALPTVMLMRGRDPVRNGALHPALSSLFRVTDGLRMTMHQMLFVPVGEPALDPQAPMTAAEVYAYAERNYSFHSEHGVCAGPQAMVEEFLSVAVDGATPRDGLPDALDPALEEAVRSVEVAMDYGLRGLQVYAAVFSLWPQMVRSYETLATITSAWAEGGLPVARALEQRFAAHLETLRAASYLATEDWRAHRDLVYGDMHAKCARGLGADNQAGSLLHRLAPWQDAADFDAELALWQCLWRLGGGADASADAHLGALHAAVMDHLRRTRAVLACAAQAQSGLNAVLGRDAPLREPEADDLDLHNRLIATGQRQLPFLIDEIEAAFGLAIHVTPSLIGVVTESAGMVPDVPRTQCAFHQRKTP